ncbi:heme exporter protein CcmD [Glaesserella sp.]|uniref:heme exporter protein CcmD n=1 Tax=Glaesserella sp. TaxID=2094731 RepID=UPI0035A0578D
MTFQFDSISAFFDMGGYGFYVWLAYGITFLTMGLLIWQSKREGKQIFRQVRKEQAREAQRNKQS